MAVMGSVVMTKGSRKSRGRSMVGDWGQTPLPETEYYTVSIKTNCMIHSKITPTIVVQYQQILLLNYANTLLKLIITEWLSCYK